MSHHNKGSLIILFLLAVGGLIGYQIPRSAKQPEDGIARVVSNGQLLMAGHTHSDDLMHLTCTEQKATGTGCEAALRNVARDEAVKVLREYLSLVNKKRKAPQAIVQTAPQAVEAAPVDSK